VLENAPVAVVGFRLPCKLEVPVESTTKNGSKTVLTLGVTKYKSILEYPLLSVLPKGVGGGGVEGAEKVYIIHAHVIATANKIPVCWSSKSTTGTATDIGSP
jgi:hypothetical protein